MVLEAAGLALLAAVSPMALLVSGVFLGSARPKVAAASYLAGAVVMSLIMGLVLLAVLRGVDLNRPDHHAPRYGFRLGLGLVLIVAGAVVAVRKKNDPNPSKPDGIIFRLAERPTPLSAFIVGVLVFAPGASFLAAVQVIATSRASFDLTAIAVVVVVAINATLVWLPLLLYVAAPRATGRRLVAFNGWLRVNGRTLLIWVLAVVGAIMVGNGIYGLALNR